MPTETITVQFGDPILNHRFPLSKLALLSNPSAKTQSPNPPSTGQTTGTIAWAVKYYFGLVWVQNDTTLGEPHWEYANMDPLAVLANAPGFSLAHRCRAAGQSRARFFRDPARRRAARLGATADDL
ncbi:MAG: hypothetical protein WDO13_19130 [Verrucomicrobiota bacterium]